MGNGSGTGYPAFTNSTNELGGLLAQLHPSEFLECLQDGDHPKEQYAVDSLSLVIRMGVMW